MPTAAKLVGALAFALVGYLAAEAYKSSYPSSLNWGHFALAVAILAVVIGWFNLGPKAGQGYLHAAASGVQASVLLTFYTVLGFSIQAMIDRAVLRLYDGVWAAIIGALKYMTTFGAELLHPEPLAVLILGGVFAGLASEYTAKRWR